MYSLEATLSFLFFIVISTVLLLSVPEPKIDDSLYRLQLAQDSWRVLYLRGDFENFGAGQRDVIERDMAQLGSETSFCFFLDGVEFTNCRSGDTGHEIIVSLSKTIIYEGMPRTVTFSIGK